MHPGPAPRHRASTRASARAAWLGLGLCALVVGCWFLVSRSDGGAPMALSAVVADAESLSPTPTDLHGDPASSTAARRPAASSLDEGARAGIDAADASPDVALLIAGRVVVPGGSGADVTPVAQARLYVEAQRRDDGGRLSGWTTTPLRALSDAAGRFSIAAPAEGTPEATAIAPRSRHGHSLVGLRITARRIGHVDATQEFEPGAAGVELVLARCGWLTARIVHGGADDGPRFALALVAGDERITRTKVTHEREIFTGVPAGDAALTVWLQGDPEPLVVLQGLCVPPGATCDDPRLDPLDVSGRIADYAVRVVNDRGEVVQRPAFWVAGDALAHAEDGLHSSLRALADSETEEVLGAGWWRVHARAPVAPDILVTASDHDTSAPATLHDGATLTLRSMPRFMLELARDPPPGRIQLQRVMPEGPAEIVSLPAARVLRVPGFVAGRARARLTQGGGRQGALPEVWPPETTGPWVEFEVPASGEGRALLDLGP